MSKIVKFAFMFMIVLGLSAIAMGQSTTTGAIGGVVNNPNKEVVPGASVSVRNVETNKEDSATTDDAGRFKVANLQPGRYAVTVNSSGFSPLTQENVVVEVGRETSLEVALSVGQVTGTVDVTAEAPVINTTQQDFSSNLNQTSINELPVNGRRWSNLVILCPGTTPYGTIGGPIVKDKVFFFFSYDQQKRDFPAVSVFTSPTYLSTVNTCASATAPGCTTALFAASLKNPSRVLTDAQISSTTDFLNSLTGIVPRRGDQKLFFPKLDWNINDKNTFTASYNRLRWESPAGVQTAAAVTRGRASYGNDFVEADSVNLRLSSTISPTLLNEARFQWSRDFESQVSQPPLPGEPTTAGGGRSPSVVLTNGLEFGKPNFLERRAQRDERRLQFADTVTISSGNHTFKFGGDINRVRDKQDSLFTEAGQYTYGNINDFIVSYVNFTSNGALRTANKQCF